MPDPRFYETHAPLSLADVIRLSGARIQTDATAVTLTEAAPLGLAGPNALSFLSDKRRIRELRHTRAGAVLVSGLGDDVPEGCAALICDTPQAAWSVVARVLHAPISHRFEEGPIHSSAELESDIYLGPGVVIGQNARIGRGTIIQPGAVIGPGVEIGRGCSVGANATIGFALIGDRVSILAGARIGEAGFGVASSARGPVDVPQLGRAILQDNVTVGANSCVDRGAWDDTVIGENSKLDNFVHVAHNVRMGRNCRLAAYTGISGSVTIGDGAVFGGRSGVADQLTIGEGAAIGAAAGVFKSVPSREVWTGYPARPMRRWLREQAALARLARTGRATNHEDEG